jgi:hypothetical protein
MLVGDSPSTHNYLLTKEGFPCLTRRRIVNEALPRWRVGESNFGPLSWVYSCMVEPSWANVMFYKISVILLLLMVSLLPMPSVLAQIC